MEKRICEFCGKEIEGFNTNHANFLLLQHKLKHREKVDIKEVKK